MGDVSLEKLTFISRITIFTSTVKHRSKVPTLVPDGHEIVVINGVNRSSKDEENYPVTVSTSQEAIHDYGWLVTWQAAEPS